jgi:Ni,Fe-hydrogenase maturation factor
VGVEPDVIKTGIGLSPAVESAVPAAVAAAQQILQAF